MSFQLTGGVVAIGVLAWTPPIAAAGVLSVSSVDCCSMRVVLNRESQSRNSLRAAPAASRRPLGTSSRTFTRRSAYRAKACTAKPPSAAENCLAGARRVCWL